VKEEDKFNEHLKLVASWLNSLSMAVMVAGTVVPTFQFFYGFLPQNVDPLVIYLGGVISVICGLFIHVGGHRVLGGLQ
jgi:amino acid transporter